MKRLYKYTVIAASLLMTASCADFLERQPESMLTPESYLKAAENLDSYAYSVYPNCLPSHGAYGYGTFTYDTDTDNMAYVNPNDIFAPGYVKVAESGGAWNSWGQIHNINYFFGVVLPYYENGEISGAEGRIRQAIGEMYFFRAYDYFGKLQAFGDLPIITTTQKDDLASLTENSKRSPRNEVARFILSDLDKAIDFLNDSPLGGTNRLNKDCAHLMKARVALYEGTWLKYFKGTAFVPNGPDWPGATKEYNSNYSYPLGDIDSEIAWFLEQAMTESKIVADSYQLTSNTGRWESALDGQNPYFDMFAAEDMSKYPEVLLWRDYHKDYAVHGVGQWAAWSNNGYGTTKSMVDAFVMKNGLPIYAAGSGYPGDKNLKEITKDRDTRAVVFIKRPGDENLRTEPVGTSLKVETWPEITASAESNRYPTGYALRKGMSTDGGQTALALCTTGCVIFRAAEAYLIYMEACYEKTGAIDGVADGYWRALRQRAKVDDDYMKTINATDMAKEAETDWGAYSAGQLVDATLFNIRRERRCELMAEGFRPMDVRRWRAMDQMIDRPYHVLGMNLWENNDLDKFANLVEGQNVSKKSFNKYLAPYHIQTNNHVYNGYSWSMAHYLTPIAIQHFLITGGGVAENSILYQNPGWSLIPNEGPLY